MEKVVAKQRNVEIDVFRGLGILLMIMGHIGFGDKFDQLIHAFNMPMFFFVSGIFFRVPSSDHSKALGFMKRRVHSILVPYFSMGILHYVIWLILEYPNIEIAPLANLFFYNTEDLPIAGALWFLTALFWAELVYYGILMLVTDTRLQNAILILLSLFGCVAADILPFRLPWALDAALVGVGFLHLGALFAKYKHTDLLCRISCLRIWEWGAVGLLTVILIFCNGYINMRTGSYANIALFWINNILAFVVGMNAVRTLVSLLPPFVITPLARIGENSIIYLAFNQLAILCLAGLLDGLGLHKALRQFGKTVLVIIVLYAVMFLFTKTKLKILIGKN